MDSLGNIWKDVYSWPKNRSALWLLIIVRYTNTLTYLLNEFNSSTTEKVSIVKYTANTSNMTVNDNQKL